MNSTDADYTNATLSNITTTFDAAAFIEQYRNQTQKFSIIQRVSGSLSLVGSLCIVIHILRSHHRLSTTYHRLMLGLSLGDILVSVFAYLPNSVMVPEEMNYWVPGAQGNTTTCTIQGFLFYYGSGIATLYNCSVCFYYLSIIRYNKKDVYIRTKLEPWFHAVPHGLMVVVFGIHLSMKGYNTLAGICATEPNARFVPHCNGILPEGVTTTIPCDRGQKIHSSLWFNTMEFVLLYVIPPAVLIGTMFLMYLTVSKIERNAKRYGVRTLRLKTQRHLNVEEPPFCERCKETISRGIKGFFRAMISRVLCRRNISNAPRTFQKRSVLNMAGGYALAWAIVWVPTMLGSQFHNPDFFTFMIILFPLQGFLNFIVFMMPKIRSAKRPRRKPELSWPRACIVAYLSRGARRSDSTLMSSLARKNSTAVPVFKLRRLRHRKRKSSCVATSVDMIETQHPINSKSSVTKCSVSNQVKNDDCDDTV